MGTEESQHGRSSQRCILRDRDAQSANEEERSVDFGWKGWLKTAVDCIPDRGFHPMLETLKKCYMLPSILPKIDLLSEAVHEDIFECEVNRFSGL